jgi:DNA topoisomerase-1
MAKSLVIVESPAKAKTIGKYLGRNYSVKASIGHIKDLPKSKLGVDVEHGFAPEYAIIPGKEKVVKELRSAAKGSDAIYLAADPDREGEAICQHLAEELSARNRTIYRVLFQEITKNAIMEAFKKPGHINSHKVDAQLTRRILDRLVGYKISPLLWDKVRRGLSAGRVQTVALRMIVERELEIRAFKSEEYWNLAAKLEGRIPPVFTARARTLDGEKWNVGNGETAHAVVDHLRGARFVVDRIHRREKKRYPVPPFITSRLQQDAARRLNFPVRKTMLLAQRLYEGLEIGEEGATGLITYMRTDSTRVSESALAEVRDLIRTKYGEAHLPHHPIYYKSKKTAQEAHEAIRPTSVEHTPESLAPFLEPDLLRLYELIYNRFVASQMNPAVFDQTDVYINAGRVGFKATGSVPKFQGFLSVYQESRPDDAASQAEAEEDGVLPALEEGETLEVRDLLPTQHFTQPPPRYNEASLVKALEARGIGRPSTYATILSTIQDREYVTKHGGKFVPTEIGEVVVELLVDSFQELFDYEYTARMEDHLDRIESGREKWNDAMRDFYDRFSRRLAVAEKQMRDVKTEEIETEEICDKCGRKMVIKWGKFGRFIACSGYPACKNTREIPRVSNLDNGDGASDEEELLCEKCGRAMVLKRGRFGEFMACSGYPDCRNTKKIVKHADSVSVKQDVTLEETCPTCGKNLAVKHGRFGEYTACSDYPNCKYIKHKTTGVSCPKCRSGEIVERRSRRGKIFYGCSEYPNCDFVLWNRPVPEPCPECKAPFTVVRATKRTGPVRYCNNEDCGFKEPIVESA